VARRVIVERWPILGAPSVPFGFQGERRLPASSWYELREKALSPND
jgi:hypothetical protein